MGGISYNGGCFFFPVFLRFFLLAKSFESRLATPCWLVIRGRSRLKSFVDNLVRRDLNWNFCV